MNELRRSWQDTRLVVLTAISAALYAAILIPFKMLPIIPGLTELRPANAVPIVCSFLFGPAAAWGSAIGNLIGDLFAGLGPGDLFGFFGNFLYGLIPYRAWALVSAGDPLPRSPTQWLRFLGVVFFASAACALVVGWGLNLLGFVPFPVLGNVVLWNDFLAAALLAPLVLRGVYPRVKAGKLRYADLVPQRSPTHLRRALLVLAVLLTFAGHVAGNLIYARRWTPPWVAVFGIETVDRSFEIGWGLAPFVAGAATCVVLL